MGFEHLLGSAVVISLVAAFWNQIKILLFRIAGLLIVKVTLDHNLAYVVVSYCRAECQHFSLAPMNFESELWFIKPLSRMQLTAFENFRRGGALFRKGRSAFWVGAPIKTGNRDNDDPGNAIGITFIRGTLDIDMLLQCALDRYNRMAGLGNDKKRFRVEKLRGAGALIGRRKGDAGQANPAKSHVDAVHSPRIFLGEKRFLRWKTEDLGEDVAHINSAMDVLAFPPNVAELIDEARRWYQSEAWYRKRKIPWRRGWLLHGPPGTGKTSLIKAMAYDLDLPVIVFDLASMSNEDLAVAWEHTLSSTPCIALFEDIDAVFSKRENKLGEMGGGLSFDCLLNCIGGIENSDGVLIMVTTNRIEELDDALGVPRGDNSDEVSTRPGRIDRALELGLLDESCRRKIAERILCDCPEYVDMAVTAGSGDTGAQFQERCVQIALKTFWNTCPLEMEKTAA